MTVPSQRGDHDHAGCSRRRFLQGLGIATAAAAATPLLTVRPAYAAGDYSGPVLVLLSLRGGADGLSIVPPVGDPDYATARPSIGVPASQALATGNRTFGLHPALAPLLPLWKAGTMAAVHAVGHWDVSRSHFQSMAEVERAAPGSSLRTGWLDRVLGEAGPGTVFQGVQLGDTAAGQQWAGPAPLLTASSLGDFTLTGADWLGSRLTSTLSALHAGVTGPVGTAAATTLAALDATATVVKADSTPKNGASYPKTDLGSALADVARLVRQAAGLRAVTVDFGDWDMHSDLGAAGGGQMSTHLGDLAAALAAFAQDLGSDFSRVTVATLSEFGRRVHENGSGGVDHGHGNVMLLLGGGLVGGTVHGSWPTLAPAALDSGDLAGTTDYRNVLAELLVKRQGLASSQVADVFPGLSYTPVGAFRAA